MRTSPGRRARLLLSLAVVVIGLAVSASTASAVIVKFPGGHTYSYQPLRGAALRFDKHFSNLDYNGGPVMASNTNYLIFWSPSGLGAYGSAEYPTGLETYLTDLAHDSGGNQNVDSVATQYNDAAGNVAAYKSTYGGALVDTDPYPASQCPVAAPATSCLVDSQIQAELGKFLDANHLPRDLTHEYFLISPPHAENCFNSDPSSQPGVGPYGGCSAGEATNPAYCAYHGNSLAQPVFIYANDPYVTGNGGCDDGSHPNGPSDGALQGGFSHEHNESITDPLPNDSWTDIGGIGGEDGDKCSGNMGAALGTHNGSPYNQVINGHFYWYQTEWSNQGNKCLQRFTPSGAAPAAQFTSTAATGKALNFDASASTGPVKYYNWQFNDSPGLNNPFEQTTPTISHTFPSSLPGSFVVGLTVFKADGTSTGTSSLVTPGQSGPTPGFSASATNALPGQPIGFTALPTLGGDSVIDYIWDFGDGTPAASGATPVHAYSAPGTYKVTLTMFGVGGGVVTSQQVAVDELPSASFSVATPHPASGQQTAFSGSASSDPDGSIVSYSWGFGDGSTGSGATPSHVYTAEGTYTVSLTVTDSSGAQATTSQPVTIDESPTASIRLKTKHPATGSAVQFDGSASSDPDGSIVSYSWNYGDGATGGSGSSPKHTYKKHGTYTVTLTVTDSFGISTSSTAPVHVVKGARIRKVSLKKKNGKFYLLVKVTGPGRVKVGSKGVRLTNAGTAKFKLNPGAHHKQRLKVKFTPIAGGIQRKTVTVRFR